MTTNISWTRIENACQRRAAKWFGRRPFAIPRGRGIISFCFDDFPRSALETGGGILERHGLAGTYYTSLGLAGQTAPTGRMFDMEDLSPLVQAGHELGCHTFEHCPAWETPPDTFEASIRMNAQALRGHSLSATFSSLSYPISNPRPETKRRAAKYFPCCRGGGQTFNTGTIDLNNLAAFFLEQCNGHIEIVRTLIRENRDAGGWLILATHDVCEFPTRFGCTPAFFKEIVACAMDSGAQILPVSAACNTLQARADIAA